MVKYAAPLTFSPMMTDYQEGIDFPRLRRERAEKAKEVLRRHGIPALLVTGAGNVRYLTGFTWVEFQPWLSYTLFFAEHDPVVFAHAGSYQQMPDQAPWIKHWRIGRAWLEYIGGMEAADHEAKIFAQEIHDELNQRGLAGEKLGIVGFDQFTREHLRARGLNVVEGWTLLLEAAKTKTVDEINCLKMATSFCTIGWQKFMEIVRPGMSTGPIHRQVSGAVAEAGAEEVGGGIISGPFSFERNVTFVNRRIESGEILYYLLCGTSYMGYKTCQYRTFKVGARPTAKEKDWYNKLRDRLDAAIEATKVGNTTADAAKAFPPASTWGYKDEAEVLTVEVGHGIGLVTLEGQTTPYNPPVVNRQWSLKYPQPFEKGMVIAYEALEGEHRVGGVRLEDVVVVTDHGAELIDFFPRDEITVVGM